MDVEPLPGRGSTSTHDFRIVPPKSNDRQELYCLKCDISKCFASINHGILLKTITEKIRDPETLWLIGEIVGSFETGNEFDHLFPESCPFLEKRPRGIPIGNLTSQLFVNIYLDALDKFVKNDLGQRFYIRYVDDFVILGRNKKHLHRLRQQIGDFLRKNLFLEMHPSKQRVFPAKQGIDFLGFVVFEDFKLLRKSNKEKFRKRLRKMKKLVRTGKMSEEKATMAITSHLAHVSHADSHRLRKRFFGKPLKTKDRKEIKKIISGWKNEWPIHGPSGQLRLF